MDLLKAFNNVRWDKFYHIIEQINLNFKNKKKYTSYLYVNKRAVILGENEAYDYMMRPKYKARYKGAI